MKLLHAHIENFLVFQEADIALDDRGLYLIEGNNRSHDSFESNGSGKTTVFSAIIYGLFGKTPSGHKAARLVNRQEGKNMKVEIDFQVGNDTYKVIRYYKHSKYKNTSKLYKNEQDITQKSVADTSKEVLAIIGMTYETFMNTVYFGESNVISFSDGTDKTRKELMEDVLDLSVYAHAHEVAKDKIKDAEQYLRERKQERQQIQWELGNVSEKEKQDQESYSHTQKLIEEGEAKLKEIERSHIQVSGTLSQKRPLLEEKKEQLQVELDEITIPDTSAKESRKRDLSISAKKKEDEISALDDELQNRKKKFLEFQTNPLCPSCGQVLSESKQEEEKEKQKDKLRKKLEKRKSVQQELDREVDELDAVTKELMNIEDTYSGIREKRKELRDKIQQIDQYIQKQEREIDSFLAQEKSQEEHLRGLRSVPVPEKRTEERDNLQVQLSSAEEGVAMLEQEVLEYQKVQEIFSNKGVRSYVLDAVTPFLNKKANEYLGKLTGNTIQVQFETQKENQDGSKSDKFTVEVHRSDGEDGLENLSGGEKRRLDISVSIALQDLIISRSELSTNIVMYDECFDKLDGVGCENVVELLKERANTIGSIFVITHSQDLKALFDNHLIVTKDSEGISSIEER